MSETKPETCHQCGEPFNAVWPHKARGLHERCYREVVAQARREGWSLDDRFPRVSRVWSPRVMRQVQRRFEQGASFEVIGRELGRSGKAVSVALSRFRRSR